MIDVLIADDHAIVREGLKQILATTPDISVASEAANGQELLDQLALCTVDVILLDLSMPGPSGPALIRQVVARVPATAVLVLSMHKERQFVLHALRAGARGYVSKDSEPETLIAGIRQVAAGERFIDPAFGPAVPGAFDQTDAAPRQPLSERELQVLQGLAGGLSLIEIAQRLHLSPKTVSTHKTRLMEKLGVDNNADLLRFALLHGVGGIPPA